MMDQRLIVSFETVKGEKGERKYSLNVPGNAPYTEIYDFCTECRSIIVKKIQEIEEEEAKAKAEAEAKAKAEAEAKSK